MRWSYQDESASLVGHPPPPWPLSCYESLASLCRLLALEFHHEKSFFCFPPNDLIRRTMHMFHLEHVIVQSSRLSGKLLLIDCRDLNIGTIRCNVVRDVGQG